jgi:hypothetical protein
VATTVRSPTTTWTDGSAPTVTQAELESLDAAHTGLVDGVEGGTWAPASAIVLDGTGFALSGPLEVIGEGAVLEITADGGTGSVIQLEDDDWPELGPGHSGRTRSILTPCGVGQVLRPLDSTTAPVDLPFARDDGAIQFLAHSFDAGSGAVSEMRAIIPLRVHDGATLDAVTLRFSVAAAHAAVAPVTMPKARVIRQAIADGTVIAMTSVAGGADASGFVAVPSVTSGSAWYAGGAKQTLAIACDQHNVIDIETYAYFVELLEEQGLTVWPWRRRILMPCRGATTSNHGLSGLAAVDGITPAGGERFLVKSQTDTAENGVYEAASGAWVRAIDLGSSLDSTYRGALVYVNEGDENGGTIWQIAALPGERTVGDGMYFATKPSEGAYPSPSAIQATGSTWYSARADFSGIVDGRFA